MRRLLFQLISWLPVTALALVVATVAYLHVRYTPRCTILTEDSLLHVSHDGRWLLTCRIQGGATDSVSVWDVASGEVTTKYFDKPHRCYIAPHRELLVGVGQDEIVRIVDWRTGKSDSVVIGDAVRDFFIVGRWCVAKPSAAAWMVIELDNGRVVRRFPHDSRVESPRDDRRVHVLGSDSVQRWDLKTMRLDFELPVACKRINWPASGHWLGTWDQDGAWTVWDTDTGQIRHHIGKVWRLRFSQNGRRMALVRADHGEDWELNVVDTESGQLLIDLTIQPGSDCIGFSADEQQVCISGAPELPNTMMIDVPTGNVLWQGSHNGNFLPDDNIVLPSVTSGPIWEADTGKELVHGEWVHYTKDCQLVVLRNKASVTDQHWFAKLLPAVLGEGELLQVMEADSMREVYRARLPANELRPECAISADGAVLVTRRVIGSPDSPTHQIDVWNMNPWRARAVAGISGIGTLLIALGLLWWRRRRSLTNR